MQAVYELQPEELTLDFFTAIKNRIGGRQVKITIETPADETEYLLQDPENRKLLLAGIEAGKQGRYSHTLTLEQIEAMAQ
jgi:hypothetical protein